MKLSRFYLRVLLFTVINMLAFAFVSPPLGRCAYEWSVKPAASGPAPAPRAFFASDHLYDRRGDGVDVLMVHGGIGAGNTVYEWDGAVWAHSLYISNAAWIKRNPDEWTEIPVPRAHHAAVVWGEFDSLINVPGEVRNNKYFIMLGGIKAGDSSPTNEMLSLCEYGVVFEQNGTVDDYKRFRWVTVQQTGDTPSARSDHTMTLVPNIQDPIHPYIFLAGGKDSSGNALDDCYLGYLSREITLDEDNMWNFEIEVTCQWELLENEMPLGLYGHSALYDPYYQDHRSILIYGGEDELSTLSDNLCIYDLDENDWDCYSGSDPGARMHHASTLDIREHRLVIHGGIGTTGEILDDAWYLDLSQSPPQWYELQGQNYSRAGHCMAYDWVNIFGGLVSWTPNYTGTTNSIVRYTDLETPKEWIVAHGEPFGLDDPASVINTARVKQNDIVRIVATEVGDYFKVRLRIFPWVGTFSIEGDPYQGSKPGLYMDYSETFDLYTDRCECGGSESYEEILSFPSEDNKTNIVIRDYAGLTIRNLEIGHCIDSPENPEIPATVLEDLADYTSDGIHFPSQFVRVDTGILTAAPTIIENCDFIGNVVGICNICVSSPDAMGTMSTGCRFYRNFLGIATLETSHVVQNNVFEENYYTAVFIDKGGKARIHDNLFINNGNEEQVNDNWRCAVFSGDGVTGGVPDTQHPLIYNNTFAGDYCALRVCGFGEMNQWLNLPVFFNNIIYEPGSGEGIIINGNQDFTFALSRNSCYYDDIDIFSYASAILQSSDDIMDDPAFENSTTGDFHLKSSSPAINMGIFHLLPGMTSQSSILDYGQLDAGYHFSWDESAIDPVEDLHSVDEDEIAWEAPSEQGLTLMGYLIVWGDSHWNYLGQAYISGDPEYEIENEDLLGSGIIFGVSAYFNNGAFSQPAFIEM